MDRQTQRKKEHRIAGVRTGSAAWELGIEPGMYLVSVNGQEIEDIFDYEFLIDEGELELVIREENGDESTVCAELEEGEDLGLTFENSLMSEYRSCANRCIFCFIDQNPPGMRETLYFKDDDARLAFLQGNYITLTNLSERDIERIIRYRMEPINISVHTTNPELRVKMLRNRFAGEALKKMKRLKDAGIAMNGQIVLCKGWNDGAELERTIRDLTAYLPELESVSVVPVGLTRYRDGLEKLESFDRDDAEAVIDLIESWQQRIYDSLKASYVPEAGEEEPDLSRGAPRHFIHASDEWYILAGRPLPEAARYDGYLQYENGVGMLRYLIDDTEAALGRFLKMRAAGALKVTPRRVTAVTGKLAAPYIRALVSKTVKAFPEVSALIAEIRNDFFGEKITVTGLLTGGDIIAQLLRLKEEGAELGDELLIPVTTLRRGEEVFLDDRTIADVRDALQLGVRVIPEGGEALIRALLGLETGEKKERQYYE